MNYFVVALLSVVSAQDAYQAIGQEVGSIYARIGAMVSASTYQNADIIAAHNAAETAISSLRVQINTIDWNALIGPSAAEIYTSQLGDYIQDLVTVNQHLNNMLTAEPLVATSNRAATATIAATVGGHPVVGSANVKAANSSATSASASASSSAHSGTSSVASSAASSAATSKQSQSSSKASSSASRSSSAHSSSSQSGNSSTSHNGAVTVGMGMGAVAAMFAALI